MVLRTGVFDLSKEKDHMNVFYYLRSKNQGVYEATIKAIVAGGEIFQNRFDLIVDDLIEFYNSEMVIIEELGLIAL